MSEHEFEEFTLDSVIRGHHVYKSVWTPAIGEVLPAQVEEGNSHDQYAVAVSKGSFVVGHVPKELSRTFFFFPRHGGVIETRVTGHRRHGNRLEVPCTYVCSGKPRYIKRLVKLLVPVVDKK